LVLKIVLPPRHGEEEEREEAQGGEEERKEGRKESDVSRGFLERA